MQNQKHHLNSGGVFIFRHVFALEAENLREGKVFLERHP